MALDDFWDDKGFDLDVVGIERNADPLCGVLVDKENLGLTGCQDVANDEVMGVAVETLLTLFEEDCGVCF